MLESEKGIFHNDWRLKRFVNDHISILKSLDNVVLTKHFAFYTDQGVEDMVYCGVNSLSQFVNTNTAYFEIK